MLNQFSRTELLLGKDGMEKLYRSRVAVFGLGGVGGYVVEALARSGIGRLSLIDSDKICLTNLNRQILATRETLGKYKADAARERVLSINPDIEAEAYKVFYMPDNADMFDFSEYDYIVDAIDTVTAKLEIIVRAEKAGTPVISCMGAGNKLEASALEVADIYKTEICPLARVMRRELKKRGIKKLKVVYSKEKPIEPVGERAEEEENVSPGRRIPGSTAFVPAVAGLIIAGEVVKDLISEKNNCISQ